MKRYNNENKRSFEEVYYGAYSEKPFKWYE